MLLRKITLGRLAPVRMLCCSRCHSWRVVSWKFIVQNIRGPLMLFFPIWHWKANFQNAWKPAVEYRVLLFTDWAQMMCLHLREQSHLPHHLWNSMNAGVIIDVTTYRFCKASWVNSSLCKLQILGTATKCQFYWATKKFRFPAPTRER